MYLEPIIAKCNPIQRKAHACQKHHALYHYTIVFTPKTPTIYSGIMF